MLFDNFYVNADVSADGHNWSTSAIAPDYVQKMWPNSYAGRRKLYDYEGGEAAALPPAGYLWTNAAAAGHQHAEFRLVGDECAEARGRASRRSLRVRDPMLAKVTNMNYRGFDLDYPDIDRAKVFLADLAAVREDGHDAAADVHADRQRSHFGHGGRQDRSAIRNGG